MPEDPNDEKLWLVWHDGWKGWAITRDLETMAESAMVAYGPGRWGGEDHRYIPGVLHVPARDRKYNAMVVITPQHLFSDHAFECMVKENAELQAALEGGDH